jgi:hypothetical protein
MPMMLYGISDYDHSGQAWVQPLRIEGIGKHLESERQRLAEAEYRLGVIKAAGRFQGSVRDAAEEFMWAMVRVCRRLLDRVVR